MTTFLRTTLFTSVMLCLLFTQSLAQSCSYSFSNNKAFSTCTALPQLNGYLHWTYNPTPGTADIAYRVTGAGTSSWIAWAINPTGTQMTGAQALVAYQNSSGVMHAYTSSISGYTTSLAQSNLSFAVSGLSAEKTGNDMIIYATVTLPDKKTTLNQVWQVGPMSSGSPSVHPQTGANMQSFDSLNLLSGEATSSGGGGSRLKKKNVHGVLNAVSWGILMPMGAIIARYMRVFQSADPAWFYLHIACQTSAYSVGVAGWATGLKLGSESVGITYSAHRNIGIALFCLATLQVFALLLRPKKDTKIRFYWNIYHHATGYAVIILSIINIFKGFDILDPEKKWKRAYTGVIIFLGAVAVILEAITWPIVLKRRKHENKQHHGANGTNGANVYSNGV